jgi:hypothetical protein
MATSIGFIGSHGLINRLIPGQVDTMFAYRSSYVSSVNVSNVITWTAPTTGPPPTLYKLEYSTNNSTWITLITSNVLTSTHSVTSDSGAAYYRVSASADGVTYGPTKTRAQTIFLRNTAGTAINFAVPATTNRVAIMCSGGGSGANFNGGGGGGLAISYGILVTPSSNLTYTVGAAGGSAAAGGSSSILSGATSLVSSTGGTAPGGGNGTRAGSSGIGTVSSGSSIFVSAANLGGIMSQTTNPGTSYVAGTTYTGSGGGGGTNGAGANGTSSSTTGVGGAGGGYRTFFGYNAGSGGGGYGSTTTGSTSVSNFGGGSYYVSGTVTLAQAGAMVIHYFS